MDFKLSYILSKEVYSIVLVEGNWGKNVDIEVKQLKLLVGKIYLHVEVT